MRLFQSAAAAPALRNPQPTQIPELDHSQVAALYRAARVGGDFFDFVRIGQSKLMLVLLDIAGKRERALHVAAAAQDVFRARVVELYSDAGMEDADAVTQIILELNRTIMAAAEGICHTPAFLACYDEEIATLSYINAGHIPGLLKDEEGILRLNANGLPLGLFSHSTHDSQFAAMVQGAVLVVPSRGVVEMRHGREEFGIEGVEKALGSVIPVDASAVCHDVLSAAEQHAKAPTHFGPSLHIPGLGAAEPNDSTVLALLRK